MTPSPLLLFDRFPETLMMGDEYLPDDLPGEASIARIACGQRLATSLEGAPTMTDGIGYRVVD